MTPQDLEHLAQSRGTLTLTCNYEERVDVGPPLSCGATRFMLDIRNRLLTWYSMESRIVRPVAPTELARLLALADDAIDQPHPHAGADTPAVRPVSCFQLHRGARLRGGAHGAFELHHNFYRNTEDAAWGRLLLACADCVAEALAPGDLRMWAEALRQFSPDLLWPVLNTPAVMPVAPGGGLWSFPLGDRGLYVRVGQPPGRSELYRVAREGHGAKVLRVLHDGSESPPIASLALAMNAFEGWRDAPDVPSAEPSPSVRLYVGDGRASVRAVAAGRGVWVQRA